MDVSIFDEHICSSKQNQSKLNINDSDLEDITDEEEFCLSGQEADKNDDDFIEIPESILSYEEVFRKRASALEHLILEDLEKGDVSSMKAGCSNDLLSQGAADIAGNVISEALNKEMDTTPGGTRCPSESELDWNIGNTDGVQCDEFLESERQFHLELKALESKLMEEDERRAVEFQIKREKQQKEEREKEEWKKHRQRDFEDKRTEGTSEPLRIGMPTVDTETEEKGQKELLQQQELICSLQRQMEDERRALEELLKEEKSRTEALRLGAAIQIQAGFRGLLARRRFRIRLHSRREETRRREEEQRRREMEERRTREMEEERRRREEREKQELQRRKAEYERAKEVERLRLENERKREAERRRKEEEERKRREEEERRIREEVERKRREEEEKRIREEEERKRREEEEKRIREKGESKRREEEEKRIREEEEKKRREEDEKRIREEEERRMQKEQKMEEENRERKDEKRKRQEAEKQRMEEKRKTEAADEKKHTIRLIDNINLSVSTSHKQSTIHDSIPETVDKGSPSHLHPNTTTTTDPQQMTPDPVPASCNSGSMTLSEQTEQKRLAWMKDCIPWSKLSLQNKRKKKTPQRRRARRASAGDCLPPISPHVLLEHGGWGSLQEVTTVCVENLPDCSLSTLAHCPILQSLTLRCCGLRALEGLGQCVGLRYIDVQDNLITSVDCENLVNLQVLHLSRNRLTSIHGLEGAVNLRILELSYNFITRIGGLESLQKLQRLCIDHNQLISTRELRVAYTLLHLDCSSNHLSTVEGLDSCALLSTLHLRTNNLTEPPVLKNQVLLRELHLEDNNISSLGALTTCWLPLLQLLSVAENSITQLPLLSDFVSLEKLDLSHNYLSEVENVCESLKRCPFLLEVDLTGNPLQQEADWRSSLLKAVPGLRDVAVISGSSPATPTGVLSSTLAEGSFLAFCQAQLQQVNTLAEAQRRELGEAVSALSAVKVFTRHHEENLQLAEDHRYAHEYGDTTVDPRPRDKSDIQTERIMDKAHESINRCISECFAGPGTKQPDLQEDLHKVSPLSPNEDGIQETTPDMNTQLPRDRPSCSPSTGSSNTDLNVTLSYAKAQYPSATLSEEKPSDGSSKGPIPEPCNLDIKSMAAVVIQRHWRKHRRCRRVPLHDGGGGGKRIGRREKGQGHGGGGAGRGFDARITKKGQHCLDLDSAATVIQASWRGWSLRKRLASALAAARMDAEEDGFEEMDVDEFVFDETLLERDWTSLVLADSPPQSLPLPPQTLYPKHHFPDTYPYQPRLPPDLQWKPKEAWSGAETPLEYTKRGASHHSTSRTKSPASPSGLSGLSERSEKILEEWGFTDSHTALLMLKRAQKMKSKKQRQRRLPDSSVRLALFRNHSNQHVPIEAPEKHSPVKKDCFKSGGEELVEQEAEEVKQTRLKQERTYEWLHTQSEDPDQLTESYHFLPQIDPDVLNGGRVQLVAAAGKQGGPLDKAPGSRPYAVSISTPPSKHSQGQNGSLVLSKKNVPSPIRTQSAPSKKERLSFRDNPVQRSGGWGGGKKRDRVQK